MRHKQIGWIVQIRPTTGEAWEEKFYTFSMKSSEDSWRRYKYGDKDYELKNDLARIRIVTVEE